MKERAIDMKRKMKLICSLCFLVTITVTGCAEKGKTPVNLVQVESEENQTTDDTSDLENPVTIIENLENSSLKDRMNPFAISMFQNLEQGENLFISPYSVYLAL